jgi:hypothetical protein
VHRKLPLAVLREIGWNHWDPIGLKDNRKDCDDEYDTYLVQSLSMAVRGNGVQQIAEYLARAESEHMGLGAADVVRVQKVAQEVVNVAKKWLTTSS